MKRIHYLNSTALIAYVYQVLDLQQQLIDAQQKIIELQQRIDDMTPKNPKDEEIFWHLVSNGISSKEAANSRDIDVVIRFQGWNVEFAKKHIKPYVNPKVFAEVLNQMTRGLPERIADLQTKQELAETKKSGGSSSSKKETSKPFVQLSLVHSS